MKSIITFFFVGITIAGYTQNKLFVNGGASGIGTSSNSFLGIGPSNSAPTSHLHILDNVDGELSLLLQNTKSPGTRTFLTSTSTRSLIQTDKDFGIFTNGGGWSEKFTVLNNGNVGVGTTVPESNLDVYAPINSLLRIRNEAYSNGSSELRFESKRLSSPGNAAGMVANASGVTQNGVPTETFGIYSQWRPIVFILSNGDGNFKEYLRIAQSGNVGIGTTNPTQKLTVKGTVYSTEVKVDLAAGTGPDYVFEPTYTLTSLDSVQSYINQNKHLPEVPSAKEMEANGVNLGEMNMLLLKKVEELTLYTIEANRKIEEQGAQINRILKIVNIK